MPVNFLRKMFRSSDTEKDAPKNVKTKRVLQGPRITSDRFVDEPYYPDVEVDDATAEVAADLLAKPLMTGEIYNPRRIKEMAQDTEYRKPTDTELRRHADRLDADEAKRRSSQRLVRTGYGGGIKTDDGSYLKFGSDDPQPMLGMKKGGRVKASGASSRGDGIAKRGKTKGRLV
jgi:hypothetical protein